MTKIGDLPIKPLSEMSMEELHEHMRCIRTSRNTSKKAVGKRGPRKAKAIPVGAAPPDPNTMAPEKKRWLLEQLQKQMEGEA